MVVGGGDAGSSAATGLVQQLRIKKIANVSAAIVCLSSIKTTFLFLLVALQQLKFDLLPTSRIISVDNQKGQRKKVK